MFERIGEQVKEIKENTDISAEDKKGVLKVAEYLLTRNDMDEKYNNPEKNLHEMWKFIKDEARKKAINGVAVFDDEEVYSIAIHYFDESNEALGIGKGQKKEKSTSKATKTNENHTSFDKAREQPKEENAPVPEHKDDEVAMIYKGRAITYKEVREGQIFAKG